MATYNTQQLDPHLVASRRSVTCRINAQAAARHGLELVGAPLGDYLAPLRNGSSRNVKRFCNRALRAEIFEGDRFSHGAILSMLNIQVNYASAEPRYAWTMAETMGDRIRNIREARGLSQQEVAEIVGVSAATISQWETDVTQGIRPQNYMRFCAYFAVDPWTLVFGPEGDPHPKKPESPRRFRFVPQRLP